MCVTRYLPNNISLLINNVIYYIYITLWNSNKLYNFKTILLKSFCKLFINKKYKLCIVIVYIIVSYK